MIVDSSSRISATASTLRLSVGGAGWPRPPIPSVPQTTHGGRPMSQTEYAHPEVLVDSGWVATHLKDPKVRLVEVDVDTSAYDKNHIPGAIGLNWQKDLQQHPVRDLLTKQELEQLLSSRGIGNDTT